jgi:hypothetical protein
LKIIISNFHKVAIIFLTGLFARVLINEIFDINVFKEYYSLISYSYYLTMSCFTVYINNANFSFISNFFSNLDTFTYSNLIKGVKNLLDLFINNNNKMIMNWEGAQTPKSISEESVITKNFMDGSWPAWTTDPTITESENPNSNSSTVPGPSTDPSTNPNTNANANTNASENIKETRTEKRERFIRSALEIAESIDEAYVFVLPGTERSIVKIKDPDNIVPVDGQYNPYLHGHLGAFGRNASVFLGKYNYVTKTTQLPVHLDEDQSKFLIEIKKRYDAFEETKKTKSVNTQSFRYWLYRQ